MIEKKQAGFTLLELMITLSILLVFILLSWGTGIDLIKKNRAQTQAHQLFHTLQFARSEAIKRNQTVIVCASSDAVHCHDDWAQGNIVFVENDGQKKLLRADKIVQIIPHQSNTSTIKYSANGRSLTRATIKVKAPLLEYHIVVYDSGRTRLETIG